LSFSYTQREVTDGWTHTNLPLVRPAPSACIFAAGYARTPCTPVSPRHRHVSLMILVYHVAVSSPPSDPRSLTTHHPNGTQLSLCPFPISVRSHSSFASADCDMANDVLQALHPGPPAKPRLVKPDGLVGLCREHIRIALNSESRALPYTINSYIMTLRSKSVFVWYGLNNGVSPLPWKHRWTCPAD